ncbi:PREDICTED: ADAMTS-like protein 3, partial [Galeopterus variegatus]|uniref:ADAMTS-like protein 3 n=1 Tax=Galeopterus variegatus TaxID=482537 RepID=A0ABM0R7M4_GALVR
VPQPNITWLKRGGSLSDNISLLFNEPFWEPGNWSHCSATCGHLGTRVQRPQCVMVNGQEVSEALCDHLQKPPARFQLCNIRDCPARWFTSVWSECSVSCGEGFHSRQVTCQQMRANGTAQVVSPRTCASKDRPLGRKPCSRHPCVQQVTGPGSQTSSAELVCCWLAQASSKFLTEKQLLNQFKLGPSSSNVCGLGDILMQYKYMFQKPCPREHGQIPPKPTFKRNCMSGACDVCWRPGPWRPCTAACGRGFQSRKVDCVHARSCKPVAERYCAQKKKPTSWRHCLGPSCDRVCTDTTHYCMFVKHLHLCSLDRYKQRCCQSCQEG